MDSLVVIVSIQIKVFNKISATCRSEKNVCCLGHLYHCKHFLCVHSCENI